MKSRVTLSSYRVRYTVSIFRKKLQRAQEVHRTRYSRKSADKKKHAPVSHEQKDPFPLSIVDEPRRDHPHEPKYPAGRGHVTPAGANFPCCYIPFLVGKPMCVFGIVEFERVLSEGCVSPAAQRISDLGPKIVSAVTNADAPATSTLDLQVQKVSLVLRSFEKKVQTSRLRRTVWVAPPRTVLHPTISRYIRQYNSRKSKNRWRAIPRRRAQSVCDRRFGEGHSRVT